MSSSSIITAIAIIALSSLSISTTAAYPLPTHGHLTMLNFAQDPLSERTPASTYRGIDNVGPAIYNATQEAIHRAQNILANYTSVLNGIAIPSGLAASFFGYFLLAPVLFLAAFITGGGACFVAVSAVLEEQTSTAAWISIAAMLLGGALCGFIAMRALSIGMFAVGASLGLIFASAFRTSLIAELFPKDPRTAFIVTAVVLGLVLGLLAVLFEKHMLIFSTAYAGACACIFGIGHFAGHFPTSRDLTNAQKGQLDGWVLLYFGLTLLLGTMGLFFQLWLAHDRPMPEYAPYDRRRRRRRNGRQYEQPPWSDDDEDWGDDVFVERRPMPPRRKRDQPAHGYVVPAEYEQEQDARGSAGGHAYAQAAGTNGGMHGDMAAASDKPPLSSEGGRGSWNNVQHADTVFHTKAQSTPNDGAFGAFGNARAATPETASGSHGKEESAARPEGMVAKGVANSFGNAADGHAPSKGARNIFSDDEVIDGVVEASPTTLVDVPLESDTELATVKV